MKKNIFFGLLILSTNLIYPNNFKVNVTKKEELQPLHKQQVSPAFLDEEEMDLYIKDLEEEEAFLNETANQGSSVDGWNVLKGVAGLWIGTNLFCFGGKGVLISLTFPDHILSEMLSRSSTPLSPVEKLLTNRLLWLSLSGALTVFSLWILKKSATKLYKGLCGREDIMECFGNNSNFGTTY